MKTVNIHQFINMIKCSRCGNKVLRDDTPYKKIREEKERLEYEIGCAICGNVDIYNTEFKKIN